MTRFVLNGRESVSLAAGNTTLLDVLRDEMHLTGVKKGCETGECGACTILLDGQNVNACMLLVGEVEGRSVTTIEGLEENGELDFVQLLHGGKICVGAQRKLLEGDKGRTSLIQRGLELQALGFHVPAGTEIHVPVIQADEPGRSQSVYTVGKPLF